MFLHTKYQVAERRNTKENFEERRKADSKTGSVLIEVGVVSAQRQDGGQGGFFGRFSIFFDCFLG